MNIKTLKHEVISPLQNKCINKKAFMKNSIMTKLWTELKTPKDKNIETDKVLPKSGNTLFSTFYHI